MRGVEQRGANVDAQKYAENCPAGYVAGAHPVKRPKVCYSGRLRMGLTLP